MRIHTESNDNLNQQRGAPKYISELPESKKPGLQDQLIHLLFHPLCIESVGKKRLLQENVQSQIWLKVNVCEHIL